LITAITVYIFLLCMLYLLPISELFPNRYLHHSLNVILTRTTQGPRRVKTSSKHIQRIYPVLHLAIKIFHIDGFAPRWYRYKNQLRLANVEHIFTVDQFVALKYLLSSFLVIYCTQLTLLNLSFEMILLTVVLTWLGFFLPDQWIHIRVKQRRRKIQREIPSILISLAVTTDAGLSLLQALEEVCSRKPGELSTEFQKTMQEIAVGIPQKEAFENMINRVLVEELTLMVSALLQTLEKGSTGLTIVLRNQANEAWMKRKSLAKETGEKASIKLFLPLMGFILPALMIFLIGPAIFTILQFFEF